MPKRSKCHYKIFGILIFVGLLISKISITDVVAQKPVDQILTVDQLINWVKIYHPVVKQTQINIEKADNQLLDAKGGFGPIISNYSAQKTFGGTQYYQTSNPEIYLPTWFGAEVYAGIENINGQRVNDADTQGKTSYFGVSVPLGKDLLIDKRRAALQQAKIQQNLSLVDQRAAVNDLLFQAIAAYWEWVAAYQSWQVINKAVEVSKYRLDLTKKSFFNGERPAIDTTEALSQLQVFENEALSQLLAIQQAKLEVSLYLWYDGNLPAILPESVVPNPNWESETATLNYVLEQDILLKSALDTHPDLRKYQFKLQQLEVDKKLKFQELLPKLDLQYNQLGKGYNLANTIATGPLFENNYRFGWKFEIPLLLQQGRASFNTAKLKIAETNWDLKQKQLSIQVKINNYHNQLQYLAQQIKLQEANYLNYKRLVEAEQVRFETGESSMFLINARESKALEGLEKLISTKTKYFKSIYALQWAAGRLAD